MTRAECRPNSLRSVGKGGENEHLAVAGIDRGPDFAGDDLPQRLQLGIAGSGDLAGGGGQRRQAVAIVVQVLAPARQIHVAEQHLDLAADQKPLVAGIVHVDIRDIDLFHLFGAGLDAGQGGVDVGELALDGEGEGGDGALHALQDVDAQQMNQALFAVHLAEESVAATDADAVFGVVLATLVGQQVAQRRVGGQCEAANLVVDLADGAKLPGPIHVGLVVDGAQALGEAPGLGGAVVALDVLARAGEGNQVEQGEVVEAQHLDQAGGGARLLGEIQPALELELGLADGPVQAGDAVLAQGVVVALGDEGDLVLQVGEAVVDRGGGEHEHPRLHAFADDPAHQAVVAGLVSAQGRLVAEVVRLVDYDQVVVAPVDVGEVDVARLAAVAREIGMVEDVVVEAVGGEEIALVVGFVKGPVVAQPLGAEHQHAPVAQFIVFDDGQGLKGLPQADAVGDNAAAEPVELVEGAQHAVALKFEELAPDDAVADAGRGIGEALLVERACVGAQDVAQDQVVDEGRRLGRGHLVQAGQNSFAIRAACLALPQQLEPARQGVRLGRGFGRLYKPELVAGSEAEAGGGEGAVAGEPRRVRGLGTAGDHDRLGQSAGDEAKLGLMPQPVGALPRQPGQLQAIAEGSILRPAGQPQLPGEGQRQAAGAQAGEFRP